MPEDIESFWEGLRPPRSPETQNPPTEGEIQAQQPRHIIRLGELEQRNQRLQELGREELNFLQHARDSGLFNGTLPTVINLLEGLVTLGCNRVNSFPSREDARNIALDFLIAVLRNGGTFHYQSRDLNPSQED